MNTFQTHQTEIKDCLFVCWSIDRQTNKQTVNISMCLLLLEVYYLCIQLSSIFVCLSHLYSHFYVIFFSLPSLSFPSSLSPHSQCQLDELEMDAEHIFPLIQIDAIFDGILQSLTVDCTHQAVTEAIHVLHTASVPNQTVFISQEASLVISILQHWLICHLCKRLMQLMTPEADILYRKQIPGSLINNYLSHQQHFSLKKLINHHYAALESCQG